MPPGDPSDPAIHAVNRSLAVVSSAGAPPRPLTCR